MSYVIVCDSRFDAWFKLFMVNRTKQRRSFWSDRLDEVMTWTSQREAQKVCNALKFNSPKVVTYSEAHSIFMKHNLPMILEKENDRIHEQAMADSELGWDGHKSFF